MNSRRDFLRTSLLAGAGATMLSNFSLANMGKTKKNIGIQLYTMKEDVEKDFKGALTKIARIGYKEFEFAGYYGNSPKGVRTLLDSLGVKAPGAHIGIDQFENDVDKVIEDSKIIGHTNVTVPWMDAKSIDDYKKAAEKFNKWAEKCKKADLQFSYHNHDFEFKSIDGQKGYDILLKETDKDLVKFELDLYWVQRAGESIVSYFEKNPGRFPLWHVKDMDKADNSKNTEVGSGMLDWKNIFSKAKLSGMKHFFVEQETFKLDRFESIKKSHSYLTGII